MEFNFSLPRLLILAACIVAFWLLDGFTVPEVRRDETVDPHRFRKAWTYCVLLFAIGAVSASVVDHYVGNIDRSNIRLLYIVIGIGLMVGSWFWLRNLRTTGAPKPVAALNEARQHCGIVSRANRVYFHLHDPRKYS
jgi:hypothetical protein